MVSFDSRAVGNFYFCVLFPLILALRSYLKAEQQELTFLSCVGEKERDGKRESCTGKMHLCNVLCSDTVFWAV